MNRRRFAHHGLLFFTAPDGAGAGGDGGAADGGAPAAGAPAAPAPGAPDPSKVVPPTPAQPAGQPDPSAERLENQPQWVQKIVRDARDDAAKARQTARDEAAAEATTKITADIAKALGITPAEGAKLEPEELQAKLTALESERQDDRRELAVYRTAGKDIDAAKLLDSRAFLAKLAAVSDPSDDKAVRAAVDEFVKDRPEYAATPGRAPGASSANPAGSGGEPPKPKQFNTLGEALAAKAAADAQT